MDGTIYFTPEFTAYSADGLSQWSTVGQEMALVPLFVVDELQLDLNRVGDSLQVAFSGTLQESIDMETWTTMDPQPVSPFVFTLNSGQKRFFRLEEVASAPATSATAYPSKVPHEHQLQHDPHHQR